jgi:cytoskeleton protein RodZ
MSTEEQQVAEQVHYAADLTSGTKASSGFASLGKCLQQARINAGYSVQQIASEMHLSPSVIDFIERDRFKELGAPVFVKGHLRRYARIVNLDEGVLRGLYDSLNDPPQSVDPIPVSMNSVPEPRRMVPNWLLWAAASLFVVVSAGTVINKLGASVDMPVHTAKIINNSSPVVQQSAVTSTSASAVESRPAALLASVAPISVATAHESSDETIVHAQQALPAGHVAVTLHFTGDSWVEVYDANKRVLLQDMAHNTSVHEVAGVAPLRVVLGSAPQVELAINGRAVSIPAKRITASVARFAIEANGAIN